MSATTEDSQQELAAARASSDWPRVRDVAERIIAAESTPAADTFVSLAQACWHLKSLEPADRAAQSALALDPTLTEALVVAAWTAVARNDGEGALKFYRRLAELNPHAPRWQLKVVQLLNTMGCIDEAVREADLLHQRWPQDRNAWSYFRNLGRESPLTRKPADAPTPRVGADQDILEAREKTAYEALEKMAPGEADWRRPLIVAAPRLDLQIAEVAGADTAVLIFTGALDGVSMPLSTFDRYMATLPVTTIYLKDFSRLFYLTGVRSLGENYVETLAALRNLLAGLGIKHLAVIGHCDGAAAGIRYGIELGARHIVSSGLIVRFAAEAVTPHRRRALMLRRLTESVSPDLLDLKPFLEARRHSAQITVLYSEEDESHRNQITQISHIPEVTVRSLRGYPRDPPLLRFVLSGENFFEGLTALLGIAPARKSERSDEACRS